MRGLELGCFLRKLEFLSSFFPCQRGKPFDLSAQSQQTLQLGQTPSTKEEDLPLCWMVHAFVKKHK